MERKTREALKTTGIFGILALIPAGPAFAQAGSEEDLRFFLERLGDFLIRTVGPGVLVIGVAVAGVSMALGDEQGMRRGALAAGGGALIMLARAVLDLIQNITHF
jgi:type IV secretory pathway VirB2 component (pilin)